MTFCLIWSSNTYAQDTTKYKHSVSIEALGLGRYGSLSYERLIYDGPKVDFYAKAGFSMIRFINYENKFKPDVLIPLMGEAVFGQKNHHFELSLGQVFATYSTFSVADEGPDREKVFSLAVGTVYRYEKTNSRWQYRAALYHIIDGYALRRRWIGASLGYKFNVKKNG
jgi:hypothetical protein